MGNAQRLWQQEAIKDFLEQEANEWIRSPPSRSMQQEVSSPHVQLHWLEIIIYLTPYMNGGATTRGVF